MTEAAPTLADSQAAKSASLPRMRQKPATPPHFQTVNDEQTLPFRQAPHNIEAEQALLGAILINNEAFDRVSAFLEPHHFFDPLHGRIFDTAAKLIQSGKNATPVTLKTFSTMRMRSARSPSRNISGAWRTCDQRH